MKKIIILFTLLALLNSCSGINNKDVSSLNFLPIDSELILNINDLTNTKEILSKNKNLSSISFSKSKVLDQLNSLSSEYSNNSGLLSLTSFGKNQTAYTYIREVNFQDSILKTDLIKGEYQNNKIFIDTSNTKNIYKTVLGNYIISSTEDIVLENIIRDSDLTNPKIDPDFLKIIKSTDSNDPFNIFINSKKSNLLLNNLSNLSFFPDLNNSWISYDFKYSLEEIKMIGATRINDSINSKITIFRNIPPSEIKSDKIIPNSFSSFFSLLILNFKL